MKRAASLLFGLLALVFAGCGGVASAENLFEDAPPVPDADWICPISEKGTHQEDCGEAVPPLQLSPAPGPSAPSPATSPSPAALDVPHQLVDVDAGVSVLSTVEVTRG